MPNLSDRLKALGVKVGAQDLPPPPRRSPDALETILHGQPKTTPFGETYLVEARYAADYRHGRLGLLPSSHLEILGAWAKTPEITGLPPQSFAFLDTETTGLSGGSGTYAFLVGIGRFEGDEFHLAQFFMRDPLEEPAQLAAIEEFLAPCQALVSFNGKAFDIPLLQTRYLTHGWRPPFAGTAHVDLLHLARRLWRDRLPSRTLGNLEVQILGASRTQQDVPGWMIPQLYFDYLRTHDAHPLEGVFYHNALDVVSLAALFNHLAALLDDPLDGSVEHGIDLISLARLFEDLGDLDRATRLYIHGLEHDLPKESLLDALQRLAGIHKRQENLIAAVSLWQEAANHGYIPAYIELAKYYEHRQGDDAQALYWTQSAINLTGSSSLPLYERVRWQEELAHRLERLQRRLGLVP